MLWSRTRSPSHTALWKLRTGRNSNPTKRLIEATARVFGVPTAFFSDDQQSEPLIKLGRAPARPSCRTSAVHGS